MAAPTLPTKITRQDLYERVWSTPVIKLAADFGVSNFVLSNLCRKHEVPTPPAGYWNKVAHGKPARQSPLTGNPDQLVDLGAAKIPGYRGALLARRKPRAAAAAPEREATTPPEAPTGDVHKKVVKTLARLRANEGKGLVRIAGSGCFTVLASSAAADRVAVVLNSLLEQVEHRSWRVVSNEKRLELEIDGERIGFELNELTDRVVHQPTEKELAAKARYEARLVQSKRTGAYISPWDAPKIPEWDHAPNGKLSLVLDESARYHNVRRTFSDRKTQRVETLIDCVVEALAGYAESVKERRLEAERSRLRAEEERVRREALKRLEALEARRVEFAERQIARLERVGRYTVLLDHLGGGELPDDAGHFRTWLQRYIAALQAELGADRIETRLAATRIMHDDANLSSWIDVETGAYRSSV